MTTAIKEEYKGWLTWCEPMYRAKMEVLEGDIPRAIEWFKEKTGQDARAITLHPRHKDLPVPEGIEVVYKGGCLSWQVWLSIENSFTSNNAKIKGLKAGVVSQVGQTIMSTLTDKKIRVDIIPSSVGIVTLEKRGPKFTGLPEDLIRQWASEGMGTKSIATKLEKEYRLVVSYKTIQRRLQGILL